MGPKTGCEPPGVEPVGPAGMPPLIYDIVPEGGRLIVNKHEADIVKEMFEVYLEQSSLLAVAQELRPTGVAAEVLGDSRW